jgi:hypothetical protein
VDRQGSSGVRRRLRLREFSPFVALRAGHARRTMAC